MKRKLADLLRYLADRLAPATWYNTETKTEGTGTTFVTFHYLEDKQ